jgi:arylsulfatase
MRRLRILGALLAGGCAATATDPAARATPNIVLILADDLGYSDLGCYGSEIRTPNLDRLAGEGMRFARFYNGARCCPTRAALLTGLYAHQAGVGHMVEDCGRPGYLGRLNDRCVTIAQVLRACGYRTYLSGKWHVGKEKPHRPVDRGFDRSLGLLTFDGHYWRLPPGGLLLEDDRPWKPEKEPFYFTDVFTDAAVRFLDEHRGRPEPFFLYLAYTAPHWPLHAWPEDIARYRGAYDDGWDAVRERRHRRLRDLGLVDGPLSPRHPDVPAWNDVPDKERESLKMAIYAAQVDRLDQGVGRVLARLPDPGNTLVLFLSDNGASHESYPHLTKRDGPPGSAETFDFPGLPWANVSNAPFRHHKRLVHEGGIATPLIARWPGVIRPGTLTREAGHVIDLMATAVDVSGATYPAHAPPLEGTSLVPAFRGGTLAPRTLFWEHEGNRAARQGRWKAVALHGRAWELYDLEADPAELRDLAAAEPERVRALGELYGDWARRAGVEPWKEIGR